MAVVVPIVSEWNPKGVDRAMADIKRAEGKMGKLKAGLGKAFLPRRPRSPGSELPPGMRRRVPRSSSRVRPRSIKCSHRWATPTPPTE